jgi:phage anti-repressor protein
MQPCYELDQTASMVLVTGYNPVCALKMMKCWNSESEPEVVEDEPVVESESEPEVVEDEPVVEEPAPEVFEIEIYAKPIGSDEVNTVNARELHGKLKVKTRFNDWIVNRIEKYKFVESQEFITLTENLVSGGKQTNYFISLDMAKQLSMVENNEQGTIARRYFIECEKIAKGEIPKVEPKPESSLIENMKAASAVIDVTMTMLNRLGIEGNQATLGANKVAAQATGFNILEMIGASAIVSPVNERYYNATHLAKELGFKSPNEFNSHLEELGYQVKEITGKVRGGNDKWHWIPTEKGKPFSVMLDTEKAHSTGTVQHLRWYASIIKEIEIK